MIVVEFIPLSIFLRSLSRREKFSSQSIKINTVSFFWLLFKCQAYLIFLSFLWKLKPNWELLWNQWWTFWGKWTQFLDKRFLVFPDAQFLQNLKGKRSYGFLSIKLTIDNQLEHVKKRLRGGPLLLCCCFHLVTKYRSAASFCGNLVLILFIFLGGGCTDKLINYINGRGRDCCFLLFNINYSSPLCFLFYFNKMKIIWSSGVNY